jgi:hypothetical protein
LELKLELHVEFKLGFFLQKKRKGKGGLNCQWRTLNYLFQFSKSSLDALQSSISPLQPSSANPSCASSCVLAAFNLLLKLASRLW